MTRLDIASAGSRAWRRLWCPPDPSLVDAGAAGELLVARIRLMLVGIVLVIPLLNTLQAPLARENHVGLGVTVAALVLAAILHSVLRRNLYRCWMGFATSVLDVSLVSGALLTFLLLDAPHTAVNSKVVFEAYFLAIFATSLRYDPRICAIVGLVAVVQYGTLVAYAAGHWPLNDARYAPFAYGMFSWNAQVGRLILLLAAAVLAMAVVLRAQHLRRLSTVDGLTGLVRRGFFDDRLLEEASRARRTANPLALAMIDVDHFKPFNDTHGHESGDAALRALAGVLRQSIRRSDVVARYGGEEFVILLPETGAADALERMEGMRRAAAQLAVPVGRGAATAGFTISIGVASWPADGGTVDEVLARADERLFQAKRAGRNRVVGPAGPAPLSIVEEATHIPAALAGAGAPGPGSSSQLEVGDPNDDR